MIDDALISVIVPVYNVEKYLDRCIESIVNQTYKNLEIILVDDGSTDNCSAICDEWAKKDNRIKVIHKENGGGGAARNTGIDAATGDVFAFIDSDDFLASTMFENLISLMTDDVDVSECAIINTFSDEADFSTKAENLITASTEEALKYNIEDKIFRQTPPNKLYRRTSVEGVYFPTGKLIDDEFWTYRVIAKARKCVHTDAKLYAYRQREDSAMHISFSSKRLQAIEAKLERMNFIEREYPNLTHIAARNLWGTCMYLTQMSMLYLPKSEAKTATVKITSVYETKVKSKISYKPLPLSSKIWLFMTNISFKATCITRNMLKFGL